MEKTILVINKNQSVQSSLTKSLAALMPDYTFEGYSVEADILNAIENRFYTLAILGLGNVNFFLKIFEFSPLARVIVLSENKDYTFMSAKSFIGEVKFLDFISLQDEVTGTTDLLRPIIENYYNTLSDDVPILNASLLQLRGRTK